jgi:RHS repeat-associated protein
VWSAKYSSFGKAAVEVEAVENNLRLPGQYYDQETGLRYNYNRYYDPFLGRYLKADPSHFFQPTNCGFIPYLLPYILSDPKELNGYVYATNKPMILIDPNGLKCCDKNQCSENKKFLECNRKAGNSFLKCQSDISKRQYACVAACAVTCIPAATVEGIGYLACLGACSTACTIVHMPERLHCIHKFAKDLNSCKERYSYDGSCECN